MSAINFDELLNESQNLPLSNPLVREYIRPRNPKGTTILLERIGIKRVRGYVMGRRKGLRTPNYNLTKKPEIISDTSTLFDFATNKTFYNECMHVFGAFGGFAFIILVNNLLPNAKTPEQYMLGLFFLIGASTETIPAVYLTLLQRYTRAKLALTIDKKLQRENSKK